MKHLSPTILALAALAPSIAALDVKDDDVKLGLALQVQVRAERGWASDVYGNPYDITANAQDSHPATADFYIRRLRFGFKGSYQGDYKFAALVRLDGADRTDSGAAGRTAVAQQLYIERIIKQESLGLEHSVRAGLDYAFFNGSSGVFSSKEFLFPSDRATGGSAWLAPRGTGVGYKLSGKPSGIAFTWGFDIQNNLNKDGVTGTGVNSDAAGAPNPAASQGSTGKGEGLCYTTRLQFVPYDSEAKGHMKVVESFVGAPGTGLLVSVEAGINKNDNTASGAVGTSKNLKAYGVEVLYHMDGLTALGEWRGTQMVTSNSGATTPAIPDQQGRCYILQAGYALPMGDQWIEPCFRWTRINLNTTASEQTNYNGTDYGTSGFQTEVGFNYYINKHMNKIQFAYQNWRGEDGAAAVGAQTFAPAKANIVRAQWQLAF